MTYSRPARTTSGGRSSGIRVAVLLAVIAAIAAALGFQLLVPSSSSGASAGDCFAFQRRGLLAEGAQHGKQTDDQPASCWASPATTQACGWPRGQLDDMVMTASPVRAPATAESTTARPPRCTERMPADT